MDKATFEFQPDLEFKYIFENFSNQERINILNELFEIEIGQDTEIEMISTENANLNLFTDKMESSRSDILFQTKDKRKLHLEFQSTGDSNMGIRVFLYGLYSDKEKSNNIIHFPLSHVIYTVLNYEKYIASNVYLDLPQFKVNGIEYKDCMVEIPIKATNLLKFTIDDFKNSNLILLCFFYLYRYIKKQDSCKTKEDITRITQEIESLWNLISNSNKEREDVKIALHELLRIYKDILSIAKRNKVNEEEIQMLAQREKSYVEILIDEAIEKTKEETTEKINLLYKTLMESGKMQEMQKAMNDKEYRNKLLNEM